MHALPSYAQPITAAVSSVKHAENLIIMHAGNHACTPCMQADSPYVIVQCGQVVPTHRAVTEFAVESEVTATIVNKIPRDPHLVDLPLVSADILQLAPGLCYLLLQLICWVLREASFQLLVALHLLLEHRIVVADGPLPTIHEHIGPEAVLVRNIDIIIPLNATCA